MHFWGLNQPLEHVGHRLLLLQGQPAYRLLAHGGQGYGGTPTELRRFLPSRLTCKNTVSSLVRSCFTDHHGFLLTKMLASIDALDVDIADVQAKIEAQIAPFADAVARLDEIPGVGPIAAAVIIAEVGVDMTRFPTPAHLSSWARFAPGVKESAGRRKGTASTGHGDRYLARVLGEAAVGTSKTTTFLGERYRRIARRRGKKKAVVAVGRSILVIVWYLLLDPETRYHDLGSG